MEKADCLPLLFLTSTYVGLVHAGWRGLANGIIHKTLSKLNGVELLEVVIGPCAGKDLYVVGREVIDAIGPTAVHSERGKEILLNLQATAQAQIQNYCPEAKVDSLDICTISNTGFHSYRRQGNAKGSNLAFFSL